jgi:hypothetical protein
MEARRLYHPRFYAPCIVHTEKIPKQYRPEPDAIAGNDGIAEVIYFHSYRSSWIIDVSDEKRIQRIVLVKRKLRTKLERIGLLDSIWNTGTRISVLSRAKELPLRILN